MSDKITEIVKQIEELKVLELNELVKAFEDKFGVSAAMPMMGGAAPAGAGAAPAAEAVEEKTQFKVTLKDSGAQKIKVIKALRTVTTLGLKEAKDLVESAPAVIAEAASKEDAQKMKTVIEEAGGAVELS